MKTIRTTATDSTLWKHLPIGSLLRVRDHDARKVVDDHKATYASKEEWNKQRDKEETNEINKEA